MNIDLAIWPGPYDDGQPEMLYMPDGHAKVIRNFFGYVDLLHPESRIPIPEYSVIKYITSIS